MKKFIAAIAVVFCTISANAQIWMGGSLGLNFTTPKGGETITTFEISPKIGYALNDKWDIAVELEEVLMACDGTTKNSFSITPFARYTFANTGKVSFFVDGGFSVGTTSLDSDGDWFDKNQTAFSIGLRPGIKIALSDKIDLDAALGFLGYSMVKDSYDQFGFNVNNNALSLGMTWKF